MEFIKYKQSIEQSANSMIEKFMLQIEERELLYKRLIEMKDSEHHKALDIRDNKIVELSQSIQRLQNENKYLKEEIDNIRLQVDKGTTTNNEQRNAILTIYEEDYQQITDDIQKAYMIESRRIIECCLDDLLQNGSGYKAFIQVEDFWSIVFVAYIYDRHYEIYEAYADNASLTQHKCHEQELYMKLLGLSSANIEEANFEEVIKYIRDANKDMGNIYPYIKNELLAGLSKVVEQMHQEFLIQEENKVLETNKLEEEGESLTELIKELLNTGEEEKQDKVVERSKMDELYSIQQINRAIKKYVSGDEWGKLKGVLQYVIKNHDHYQLLFDAETFCEYLLISYMFGYEEIFCKKFVSARERLIQVSAAYNLHCMLEAEKNMPVYTIQLNCASRAMDQGRNRNDIFQIVDGKKVLARLKKGVIPHTRKVKVMETLEKVAKDSRSTWEKYKVFVRTQEGKMILIEGWKKDVTGAWFITSKTYQNIKGQMDSKQIKFLSNTELGGVQSQNRDNQPSGTAYTKVSSITNVNKDIANGEILLNEKSPLKVLGYDTTKSKEERWRILTQQAIPKLGKTKVVWYINFFIKLHRSKPTMASAIKEWEYDLKRLGGK